MSTYIESYKDNLYCVLICTKAGIKGFIAL